MSNFWKAPLIMTVSLLSLSPARAKHSVSTTQPAPGIVIRVYNHARLPLKTLSDAQEKAGKVFERIGVQTKWLECSISPEDEDRFPLCSKSSGPASLILNIVPRFDTRKLGLTPTHMGLALPAKEGGIFAYVFIHRVDQLVEFASRDQVLGYAIAHEMGHLLLGLNSHARAGLMRNPWSREDIKWATLILRFTPRQARLIREDVRKRSRQQATREESRQVPR